jgi:hypothetical protein
MKTGKTSAATLGLVGGLALGVWIGAEMTSGREAAPAPVAVHAVEEAAPVAQPKPKRTARVARAEKAAVTTSASAAKTPKLTMTIPVSTPELQDRMKPIMARGTKMPLAIEGFTNAEQFATLAYAARNTKVPFILLKHRVLTEGQSLEEAIRASKPDVDAATEVERARSEAKSEIAALAGTATDE